MKVLVTLTPAELEEAAMAGTRRQLLYITNKRSWSESLGHNPRLWESNIQAAIAEMAVCIAYAQEFSGYVERGIGQCKDAGPLEVRTVAVKGYGVFAKPNDLPHQKIILTRVHNNQVILEGWATADEIRTYGTKVYKNMPVLYPHELHPCDMIGIPLQLSQRCCFVRVTD